MSRTKFSEELDLISPVPSDRVEEVMNLFHQTWWACDRDIDFTCKVIEGSTFSWGLIERNTNRLIAFMRVVSDCVAKATIYDVILDRGYQGKGLGRPFLNTVLSKPEMMGIQHVELYCKEEMIPFYELSSFNDISDTVRLLRKQGK